MSTPPLHLPSGKCFNKTTKAAGKDPLTSRCASIYHASASICYINGAEGGTPPPDAADGYDLTDLERAGQLGSPLLATDMELLQMKPLRPFAAGEVCAFKEALTPAQAAAAAAHRRAGTIDGRRPVTQYQDKTPQGAFDLQKQSDICAPVCCCAGHTAQHPCKEVALGSWH